MATKTTDAGGASGTRVTRSSRSKQGTSETKTRQGMTTAPVVASRRIRPPSKAPVRDRRERGKGRGRKKVEKQYKVDEAVVTGLKVSVKASLVPLPKSQQDMSVYKKLEAKVNTQVKRLKYLVAFVEAYEGEGWRSANLEKLKPDKELAKTHEKMVVIKKLVATYLREMEELHAKDKQLEPLKQGKTHVAPEEIVCSVCSSTNTTQDNDILFCDHPACFRAYHQQCLSPPVSTREIPEGDDDWFCHGCASMFESLRKINYALGTMYETPDEVFPELSGAMAGAEESEGEKATSHLAPVSLNQASFALEEDEEDEDFVMTDSPPPSDSESDQEDSDNQVKSHDGSEEPVEEVSVEEEPEASASPVVMKPAVKTVKELPVNGLLLDGAARPYRHVNFIGERVAIKPKSETETRMGRVLEEATPPAPDSKKIITNKREWRILYDDGGQEVISHRRMKRGMLLAEKMGISGEQPPTKSGTKASVRTDTKTSAAASVKKKAGKRNVQETASESSAEDLSPPPGKRKRTPVDYRKLNYLLFASQVDSDDDGEMYTRKRTSPVGVQHQSSSSESLEKGNAEDTESAPSMLQQSGRVQRSRVAVDYRAMNGGLESSR